MTNIVIVVGGTKGKREILKEDVYIFTSLKEAKKLILDLLVGNNYITNKSNKKLSGIYLFNIYTQETKKLTPKILNGQLLIE